MKRTHQSLTSGLCHSIGQNSRSMNAYSIIPPLAANSFSTSECRWLHSEAWNDRHFEYFTQNYQPEIGNIAKPYPFNHGRKSQPPQVEGRWILEDLDQNLKGWIEVWGSYGTFRKAQILVSNHQDGWVQAQSNQLAFILSAVLLSSKADLVELIMSSQRQIESLNDWGEFKNIWSIDEGDLTRVDGNPMLKTRVLQITPSKWWQSSIGRRQKTALSYLTKRIEMEERRNTYRPRLSILDRIFSRKKRSRSIKKG